MNDFTQLLQQSAHEIREYGNSAKCSQHFEPEWLERLAQRLEKAGLAASNREAEQQIQLIAHTLIDSGPSTTECAPSFDLVLTALRKSRK